MSQRTPDFTIYHAADQPYLRRWWLLPRNPLLNVYLHQVLTSDPDPELHCHPWCNVSILLRGGYVERVPVDQHQAPGFDFVRGYTMDLPRLAGDVIFRSGRTRHRLLLEADAECWSLFITGPFYRFLLWLRTGSMWGFYCRTGFIPWRKFVDTRDKGRKGAGCGEGMA